MWDGATAGEAPQWFSSDNAQAVTYNPTKRVILSIVLAAIQWLQLARFYAQSRLVWHWLQLGIARAKP
jgi:hypothetical protein